MMQELIITWMGSGKQEVINNYNDWNVEDGLLCILAGRYNKPDRYIPIVHLKEWTSHIR